MKRRALSLLVLGALGVVVACGASGADDRAAFAECNGGQTRACDCAGTTGGGTQTCDPGTSMWQPCTCGDKQIADGSIDTGPSKLCSARDGGIDGGFVTPKKCQVCDFDVEPSATTICPVAPACGNGNLGAPADPKERGDLTVYTDNGKPAADASTPAPPGSEKGACLDPQLRIRMQSLTIHKGGGDAYCIVEANDGVTSEAAITMKTGDMNDGDEFPFPVGQGLLWGQGMPECTSNNLTLTYYCYHVVDNSAWSSALKAFGDTAASIGGTPTPYGWAFGVGGAAANAAAAGIAAAQKDENRIKVQQTIPVASLLDLTNGRTWSIRTKWKDGCNLFGCDRDYDWELKIQAWGCADKLPTPK